MWEVLGVARYQTGMALPPLRWWLSLSPGDVTNLAAASGLLEPAIEGMLLSRYVGTALREVGWQRNGVDLVGSVRSRPGVVRSRNSACLMCLEELGAWRTSWCLPWTVACLRHEVYLSNSCPRCGQGLLFVPVAESQTRDGFCVFPHGPVVAVPVRDPVLLRTQQLVVQYANAVGEGERAAATDWFTRLARLVTDVAVHGQPEQLDGADEVVREGFVDWVATHRSRLPRAGLDGFGVDQPLTAALMRLAVTRSGAALL